MASVVQHWCSCEVSIYWKLAGYSGHWLCQVSESEGALVWLPPIPTLSTTTDILDWITVLLWAIHAVFCPFPMAHKNCWRLGWMCVHACGVEWFSVIIPPLFRSSICGYSECVCTLVDQCAMAISPMAMPLLRGLYSNFNLLLLTNFFVPFWDPWSQMTLIFVLEACCREARACLVDSRANYNSLLMTWQMLDQTKGWSDISKCCQDVHCNTIDPC